MSIRDNKTIKYTLAINTIICFFALFFPERARAWSAYEDGGVSPSCTVVQDYENGSIKISYTKGGGPFYITLTNSDWLFQNGQQVVVNIKIDSEVTFKMNFQALGNPEIRTEINQSKYIIFKAFNYFAEESSLRISFPESNEDVITVPFSDPSGGLAKFRICVVLN